MFSLAAAFRLGLLVVSFILAGTKLASAGLVFGGFDGTRGGVMSLTDGSFLTQLRSELASEFPGSSLAESSSLTPAFLSGIDVLFISSATGTVSTTTALSAAEQSALLNYVLAGGQAVIVVDNDTFGGAGTDAVNESFLDPFGLDSTGTRNGNQQGTITDPAHPVTDGPFGEVSKFFTVVPGWFDNLGPNAQELGTLDFNNRVGVAVIDRGILSATSGQVVFFSDTGPFIDFAGAFTMLDNKALALNSFVTPTSAVPEPSSVTLLGLGMLVFGSFGWRRKAIRAV